MLLDEKIVIAETLLSHYKTVKNIQDGQMKEFLDYIYKTLPSIYAAFVNKGCISKGDTQNIVSNYITLIKKTTKSMENAVYDAKKSRKEKDLLHRLYKIICMLYICVAIFFSFRIISFRIRFTELGTSRCLASRGQQIHKIVHNFLPYIVTNITYVQIKVIAIEYGFSIIHHTASSLER